MLHSVRKLFNQLFFGDVAHLLKLGRTRPLEHDDLIALPDRYQTDGMLEYELKLHNVTNTQQFVKKIFLLIRKMWISAVGYNCIRVCFALTTPFFIHEILSLISGPNLAEHLPRGITLAAVLCTASIVGGLFQQHSFQKSLNMLLNLNILLKTNIYKKTLVLSHAAKSKMPIGDAVNYLTADSETVSEASHELVDLVASVFTITSASALLFYYLGIAGLVPLLVFGLLFPLMKISVGRFTKADELLMEKHDARVSLMSQILSGIRVVKYFAWEENLSTQVHKLRKEELDARKYFVTTEAFSGVIYGSVRCINAVGAFGVYSLTGHELNAPVIFAALALFRLVEGPLGRLTRQVSALVSGQVSASRILAFLKLPEKAVAEIETHSPQAIDQTEPRQVSLSLSKIFRSKLEIANLRFKASISISQQGSPLLLWVPWVQEKVFCSSVY